MILLKSTYLAETNDYPKEIVDISVQQNDLNIVSRTRNYFVNGMSAYYKKNAEELHKIIQQLTAERLIEAEKAADKGLRVCGNINRSLVTKTDLQETEVMELELKAMQSWLKKDAITTEKLLQKATALQTESGYSYGPPAIIKPSFELYGEWLLENNQPSKALEQFELSLKLMPNKTLSVIGKEKALKQLGKCCCPVITNCGCRLLNKELLWLFVSLFLLPIASQMMPRRYCNVPSSQEYRVFFFLRAVPDQILFHRL